MELEQSERTTLLVKPSPTELHTGDPGGQHGVAQPGPSLPGGAGGVGPDQWSPDHHREMCLDWRILSLDWVTAL